MIVIPLFFQDRALQDGAFRGKSLRSRLAKAAPTAVALLVGLTAISLPAEAQTRYIAFGDSITFGIGDDATRTAKGYPPRLEGLLEAGGQTATVVNLGVPGEDTAEGLTRIDEALRQNRGDVLLLMEGTNDIGPGISEETTRFNLDELAQKGEGRGMDVIQATVIPRIPTARRDPENLDTQRLNEEIRDLAGGENRDLVDPFEIFLSQDDLFADFYDGTDPSDTVGHPNADGYEVLAQAFADVILGNDTVPPVTGKLDPTNGSEFIPAGKTVRVEVWDFGAGIDLANTTLSIDGTAVTATQTGNSRHAIFTYTPSTPFAGVIDVGLRSSDLASPANRVDRTIARFIISGTVFLDGDLDQDGRVDGVDLVRFARRFGATRGSSRYLAFADFNDDRVIDGDDLAILASNFGESNF